MRTTRDSRRRSPSFSPTNEVRPTTWPAAANTGPPVLPLSSEKSASMARDATRLSVPSVLRVGRPASWPRATIGCPFTSGAFVAGAQPSGTGRDDASAAGSAQSTATSLAASVASTRPSTLMVGVICTSTAVAVPTTC